MALNCQTASSPSPAASSPNSRRNSRKTQQRRTPRRINAQSWRARRERAGQALLAPLPEPSGLGLRSQSLTQDSVCCLTACSAFVFFTVHLRHHARGLASDGTGGCALLCENDFMNRYLLPHGAKGIEAEGFALAFGADKVV